MNSNLERHNHWRTLIEEQATSGLSQRAFCQNRNLVLWQFTYYHQQLKKNRLKAVVNKSMVVPVQIRKVPVVSMNEIKVTLPNGLQLSLPCSDVGDFKHWLGVLKSC
jgi:hypothetical protein